jgi:hypothetical protein
MNTTLENTAWALLLATILLACGGGLTHRLWVWSSSADVHRIHLRIDVETEHKHGIRVELRTSNSPHND